MKRPVINIVWLKRDLRLRDHASLRAAIRDGRPTVLLYCFEPSLIATPQSDVRHWRFVRQSLDDMNRRLLSFGQRILTVHDEVMPTLDWLHTHFAIQNLWSHEEVGLKITFDRDKAVKRFCTVHGIAYREFGQDGILRGQQHRDGWTDFVQQHFTSPIVEVDLKDLPGPPAFGGFAHTESVNHHLLDPAILTDQPEMQVGGETLAWRYLQSFLTDRYRNYSRTLSKPTGSRRSCSRMSPYLAYGNVSVRELWQWCDRQRQSVRDEYNLPNFQSRLYWRSHYLQKMESYWQLEFEAINPALNDLDRQHNPEFLNAWTAGRTGFPMVDASMRCLAATGWLNFRMRAMLITFTTFALWLDWRPVAERLARLFLDFEPGIHYPQIQMQAGLTGYHLLRLFNPTHQIRQHDPDGGFVKHWVPELRDVPAHLLAEPWRLTPMEQAFYSCRIGTDYPHPIVDYDAAVRRNKARYWKLRQQPAVKAELPAIWRRLCVATDIGRYQKELLTSEASDVEDTLPF